MAPRALLTDAGILMQYLNAGAASWVAAAPGFLAQLAARGVGPGRAGFCLGVCALVGTCCTLQEGKEGQAGKVGQLAAGRGDRAGGLYSTGQLPGDTVSRFMSD